MKDKQVVDTQVIVMYICIRSSMYYNVEQLKKLQSSTLPEVVDVASDKPAG